MDFYINYTGESVFQFRRAINKDKNNGIIMINKEFLSIGLFDFFKKRQEEKYETEVEEESGKD